MILSALAAPSTVIELVNRLTLHPVTPSTDNTAFSTCAEQAAQLIPPTVYLSIFYLISLPTISISSSTTASSPALISRTTQPSTWRRSSSLIKGAEGGSGGGALGQDIHAVGVVFHHLTDAAYLSLDTGKAVDQLLLFFIRTLGFFDTMLAGHIVTSFYTLWGYL